MKTISTDDVLHANEECPCCEVHAMIREIQEHTGEIYEFCYACGYRYEKYVLRDASGVELKKTDENGVEHIQYDTNAIVKPQGVIIIQYEDRYSEVHTITYDNPIEKILAMFFDSKFATGIVHRKARSGRVYERVPFQNSKWITVPLWKSIPGAEFFHIK